MWGFAGVAFALLLLLPPWASPQKLGAGTGSGSCRAFPYRYVGSAKDPLHRRTSGHRREVNKNIGSLGEHFHSGVCSEAGYTLQLLDQSPDYQVDSLRRLEGWYARQLPEVFESGSNQRHEGQYKRKKK